MTVANHSRRLRRAYIDGEINYDILFSDDEIIQDKVITGAKSAIDYIRKSYEIIFLSSRQDKVYRVTKRWLVTHGLFKRGDTLAIVNSDREKLRFIKNILPDLYAVIDDFKYDYQSGKPKVSNLILPQLLKIKAPVIIFDNNWRRIVRTYFC